MFPHLEVICTFTSSEILPSQPWAPTAMGSVMFNFMCHLSWAMVPSCWSNTGIDVATKVFFRSD